jgi:hypothetical protein
MKEKYPNNIYPDELKLKEILLEGIPMMIPKEYLFGRQIKDSYDDRKRKSVEIYLKNEGIEFLLKDPIIVCALSTEKSMQLIIVDGHHRTRYSGKYNINAIPSIVYTPNQLIEAFNAKNGTSHNAESLAHEFERDASSAIYSFRNMPDEKQPKVLINVRDLKDLPFKRFELRKLNS